MSKFVISPHFRLQEWVAEDKGYFKAEGLEYEFRDNWGEGDIAKKHATPDKSGAYQSFEKGRAGRRELRLPLDGERGGLAGHGKLYADATRSRPARSSCRPNRPCASRPT